LRRAADHDGRDDGSQNHMARAFGQFFALRGVVQFPIFLLQ
jgi:hypothetical protein